MDRSSLVKFLENLDKFLELEGRSLIAHDVLKSFQRKSQALLEKALLEGETLYLGIIGGTGVGKSTLINALAKEEISRVSDNRPTTELAVVYRNKNTRRGLEKISALIREEDALHESNALKDTLILDLPDFDSVNENNRRTCLKMLPELDYLIWVVSPEKYADASFFEMVARTSIHQENFCFVLNKTDELLVTDGVENNSKIKQVLGDLIFRLRHEAGIRQPNVFSVSASGELHGGLGSLALDGEFRRLRDLLMQRKDAKNVASLKTRNLVEKSHRLLEDLDNHVRIEHRKKTLHSILSNRLDIAETLREPTLEIGSLQRALEPLVSKIVCEEDRSILPIHLLMRALCSGSRVKGYECSQDLEGAFESATRSAVQDRFYQLEQVLARTDSELLLVLDEPESTHPDKKLHKMMSDAVSRVSGKFAAEVESRVMAERGSRSQWRRAWQKIILLLPVPLLFSKLSGPDRVISSLEDPSVTGLLLIGWHFLSSLFSVEGLAGIIVILLIQILLVYRLTVRRLRKIEKQSQAIVASAIEELKSTLNSVAIEAAENSKRVLDLIQRAISSFEKLKGVLEPIQDGNTQADHKKRFS